MEVHFPPEVQTKLEQMARDTGRRSDELVENVVTDFFDEITFTRETLDRRYDDMESGRVKPIPRCGKVIGNNRKYEAACRPACLQSANSQSVGASGLGTCVVITPTTTSGLC